ncbi:reverse transcriptase domain-containing protein, partial [Tanacetum coccineum]
MSDSEHSTVTYTSVSEDDPDIGSPGVDGPPIMPEDPYAYIPGPEVPPSPDYIPGPEGPPSPDYVPGPEEPEQGHTPLLLHTFIVSEPVYPYHRGYIPRVRNLKEDPEEDDEEDPADYPADRGDRDDEESSDDDDDAEEEHLAPADPAAVAYSADRPHPMPCRTTPGPGYEVGESLAAGTARQEPSRDCTTTPRGVNQRLLSWLLTFDQEEEIHNILSWNDASINSFRLAQSMECAYELYTSECISLRLWYKAQQSEITLETVFRISNCTVENQVKFATCTLMGTALTWWNSHARTVTNEVAYAMTWSDLKKKMTTKYCPRNEIKKIEVELWNLKVQGTDVVAYNQRFQELALLSDRMFPEETDKIERYVGGMPDSIYSSVVASKPKTMQEAIEMATELMDRRNNTLAERQAENKRKIEDIHANTQRSLATWPRTVGAGLRLQTTTTAITITTTTATTTTTVTTTTKEPKGQIPMPSFALSVGLQATSGATAPSGRTRIREMVTV